MNVDFGSCTRCGAKNSKFVESCYKCGAFLPWASTLVARKAAQSNALEAKSTEAEVLESENNPQIAGQPQAIPSATAANEAQILASLSADLDGRGPKKSSVPLLVLKRVSHRVPVPVWGIAIGMVACFALGAGLGGRRSLPSAATTSRPMDAGAISSTDAPSSSAAPNADTKPDSPPAPALDPTSAPVVQNGPAFDQLYTGTNSGTKEQKDVYWKTVAKSKVSWRGDFVQLGASPDGPLVLRCKSGNNSVLVTLNLSTSPAQTLPPMQPNQSIPVEGLLESYSDQGYQLVEGKVIG